MINLHCDKEQALQQEVNECVGILKLMRLRKINILIMVLSCCLLGFVLFDTLGDVESYRIALIPLLLMVIIPIVFAFVLSRCRNHRLPIFDNQENNDEKVSNPLVEESNGGSSSFIHFEIANE